MAAMQQQQHDDDDAITTQRRNTAMQSDGGDNQPIWPWCHRGKKNTGCGEFLAHSCLASCIREIQCR